LPRSVKGGKGVEKGGDARFGEKSQNVKQTAYRVEVEKPGGGEGCTRD